VGSSPFRGARCEWKTENSVRRDNFIVISPLELESAAGDCLSPRKVPVQRNPCQATLVIFPATSRFVPGNDDTDMMAVSGVAARLPGDSAPHVDPHHGFRGRYSLYLWRGGQHRRGLGYGQTDGRRVLADHDVDRLDGKAVRAAQRQVGARDKAWFALDSPLEGDGFEPSVPRVIDVDLGRQVPALIWLPQIPGTDQYASICRGPAPLPHRSET